MLMEMSTCGLEVFLVSLGIEKLWHGRESWNCAKILTKSKSDLMTLVVHENAGARWGASRRSDYFGCLASTRRTSI